MVEFGERLRRLRKERNLTQKQLATKIGVKNSVISFYEVGDRMPSPEVLKKLACVLHTSCDYLLGVEKKETVDISELDEEEKQIVRALIASFIKRKKDIYYY